MDLKKADWLVVELDGLMAERTEIGLVEQTVVDWAD